MTKFHSFDESMNFIQRFTKIQILTHKSKLIKIEGQREFNKVTFNYYMNDVYAKPLAAPPVKKAISPEKTKKTVVSPLPLMLEIILNTPDDQEISFENHFVPVYKKKDFNIEEVKLEFDSLKNYVENKLKFKKINIKNGFIKTFLLKKNSKYNFKISPFHFVVMVKNNIYNSTYFSVDPYTKYYYIFQDLFLADVEQMVDYNELLNKIKTDILYEDLLSYVLEQVQEYSANRAKYYENKTSTVQDEKIENMITKVHSEKHSNFSELIIILYNELSHIKSVMCLLELLISKVNISRDVIDSILKSLYSKFNEYLPYYPGDIFPQNCTHDVISSTYKALLCMSFLFRLLTFSTIFDIKLEESVLEFCRSEKQIFDFDGVKSIKICK